MDRAIQRFGSAREALVEEMKKAGIIGKDRGPWMGLDGRKQHDLRHPGDGSIAIFGGAGSGKSSAIFATNLLSGAVDGSCVVFDPRGELYAICVLALTLLGHRVFSVNPTGMPWAPQHRFNPWDHLRLGPALVADNQKLFLDLLPKSSTNRSKDWPTDTARQWASSINLTLVETTGRTSLKKIYEVINSIEGNFDEWCSFLDRMLSSQFPEVRSDAGAMMAAQKNGKESWTAPLAELHIAFSSLRDPRLADALDGDDFSMSDLIRTDGDGKPPVTIFLMKPIEYVQLWSPGLRAAIGSAIQTKLRNPGAKRVSLLLDECGQLGAFPSVVELFTFCRGANIQGICAWQERAQIEGAFGPHQADAIISSAQIRSFSGVRTDNTARLVSAMCGVETLEFRPTVNQSQAVMAKQQALLAVLRGGSLQDAVAQIRHHNLGAQHLQKQQRPLLTPDEVLNLRRWEAVTFASGLLPGPIFGHWRPYFEDPCLAGLYLGNPFIDAQSVLVATRGGSRRLRVIEEDVPKAWATLPQYAGGSFKYVEGHKPSIPRSAKETTSWF